MFIIKVKPQNLNFLEILMEMEKENTVINGRQMLASRASVVIEIKANLIELNAIRKLATNINVNMIEDFDQSSYLDSMHAIINDNKYDDVLKRIIGSKTNIDNLVGFKLPIGLTEYPASCVFRGTGIRALTSTGNISELFPKNKDKPIADLIAELFYKAVYKTILNDLDFDYKAIDTYFEKNLYSGLPKNDFTLMRVFLNNGMTSVPFFGMNEEDVNKYMNELVKESESILKTYGNYTIYAEISCQTSLFTYYILKVSGRYDLIIDEEPINEYIMKNHKYLVDSEWNDIFDKIRSNDKSTILQNLELTPANAMIHYTINAKISNKKLFDIDGVFVQIASFNKEIRKLIDFINTISGVVDSYMNH